MVRMFVAVRFLVRDAAHRQSLTLPCCLNFAALGVVKIEVPDDLQRVVVPDVDACRFGQTVTLCRNR